MTIPVHRFIFILLIFLSISSTSTAQTVTIPDLNLRAAIAAELGKASGDPITTSDMAALRSLESRESNISNLTGLEGAINLTRLSLRDNSISDLSSLTGLTNLTRLSLRDNSISDLSSLTGLTNLTLLDLSGNSISDITSLSGLTNLTLLYLSGNSISDITSLSGLTNLTQLYLAGNLISDISTVSGLINLRKLHLGGNSISDITSLSGLTDLTDLYFQDNSVSDISAVSGLTNLKWLGIGNNKISDISTVSGLTDLAHLYLLDNSISDMSAVSDLIHLTELNLRHNSVSDISAVSGLTNLKWLDIGSNKISDISAVSGLTNLTSLHLPYNSVSDISAVSGLTNLTHLTLWDNSISDISAVSGLISLTSLSLWDNSVSDISAVSGLTNLTHLSLSDNWVSDISAVSGLTNLTSLHLQDNSISDISAVSGLINLKWLGLWNNSVSDISPLVENTGLAGSDEVHIRGNPLSYLSIHTHIPTLQSRGVTVVFDGQAHRALLKVSGDNQEGMPNETLAKLFVVEAKDTDGSALVGIRVTFTVVTGGGTLSTTNTMTDANGRAQSLLTLGPNPGTQIVSVSATGIEAPATFHAISEIHIEYLLSLPTGISLIHVPLKVTSVDGAEQTIESIADLYDVLGGASTVNFLITYDSSIQEWFSYFVPSDKGTPVDRGLTADMGIIAGLRAPVSVQFRGDALGTDGSSTIALNQGLNVVGLPLRDSRVTRVSHLFALDGIGGNVPVIILTDGGEFKAVGRAGDPGDIEITGGQSFILTAQRAVIVDISGDAWTNVSGTSAAPQVALTGIKVGDTTPVLGLRGSIVDEGTGVSKAGFRVTVKNLSTDRALSTVTGDEGNGYQLTVVDIETGRAATVGDILEISAQSLDSLIGVEPLRYTVTAEDVKRSLIQLPALVAYEIPAETELLRNYPNPFNPETWIPYRLAEDAFVSLTIYNRVGQIVRTFDVGHQTAAVYENRSKAIYWDGRNEVGERVASGVYFYHLSAGDYSVTRKMVILK